MSRPRYLPNTFTLYLIGVVVIASLLPAGGRTADFFEGATTTAIGLLFFLHGARLSREAVLAGLGHWRLHLLVFACTFALFPILGVGLEPLLSPLVTPGLYTGVLFLCTLPATVQSSIAFTAMARGNVAAAVCSASASTLLGVFVTPLLVNLIIVSQQSSTGSGLLDSIARIMLQLMLPFVIGHLLRPWISAWLRERPVLLKVVDQGTILLVVYTAFSAAVIAGLWKQVPASALAGLLLVCAILLALALVATAWLARRFGFSKEDEIAIVFCGSKKSLASGIPIAQVLFTSAAVGPIVLPLMLFHQLQLMVCAMLAQRYARRPVSVEERTCS